MPQIHELVQGSPEWHQFRLEHFGASEAAAMLGLSSKVKRNELLHMKHTGQAKEFSDWVQKNILDNGHAVEELARPMAEAIIGDELYPATYSEGKLSASCDGLTMSGIIAFEHKQWNEELAAAVRSGQVPDEHQPQCQQVAMVTGAERVLFMVSNGTPEKCVYTWVESDPEWRKTLLQGWSQFAEDLANYQPTEETPVPVAAPIESLPALLVQVEGRVLSTNLDQFRQKALGFIANIKTDLSTDQDFVDAEKMVKFLKDGEDRLEAVKAQAIAQTADIEKLFATIDYLRDELRAKRLTIDKSVKTRKETIRTEIWSAGKAALVAHIDALNKRIGKPYMPIIPENFAGTMKGKKTIASLRDAVDTELARCKIAANEVADRIQVNLNELHKLAADHLFLFHDTGAIVLKQTDDFVSLVKLRIREHQEAEEQRKRKAEEEERRQEEERAKAKASESADQIQPELRAPAPADDDANNEVLGTQSGQIHRGAPLASVPTVTPPSDQRPSDDEIISVLAEWYGVHEGTVVHWLLNMDLHTATKAATPF